MTVRELAAWLERAVVWGDQFNENSESTNANNTSDTHGTHNTTFAAAVSGGSPHHQHHQHQTTAVAVARKEGIDKMLIEHWYQQQYTLQQYLLHVSDQSLSTAVTELRQWRW